MIGKSGAILKIISILAIVIVLLKVCLIFLWPFVAAIFLVILIEPFVDIIKGFGLNRKISVIISFSIIILITFFMVFYLSSYVYKHISDLFNNLPDVIKISVERVKFLREREIDYIKIEDGLEQLLVTYRMGIFNTLLTTVGGTVYTIIVMINTIFISLDIEKIDIKIKKIIPTESYIIGSRVVKKISTIMKIEVKLVLACTFQTMIGLYILGQEDALTIGIICGILDLLPVVGPGMIFIPWALYEVLVNKYFIAGGLLLLYILIEVNREIMQIKFMGKSLRIYPVVTIFSLYVGLIIYGIWGVILGPILFILFQELINFYFEGRNY